MASRGNKKEILFSVRKIIFKIASDKALLFKTASRGPAILNFTPGPQG
jgi:hypothetical protein